MCYHLPPCFVSVSSFKLLASCINFVIVSHCYRAALVAGTERLLIINFPWPEPGAPQDMKNYLKVSCMEEKVGKQWSKPSGLFQHYLYFFC